MSVTGSKPMKVRRKPGSSLDDLPGEMLKPAKGPRPDWMLNPQLLPKKPPTRAK